MRLLFFIVILLMPFFPIDISAQAQTPAQGTTASTQDEKKIVIISTYSDTYKWSNTIIEKVEKHITQFCKREAATIHLPIFSISTLEELDNEIEKLHKDLQVINPQVVILVGSNSFMLCEDIDKWFPGISMLLIGGQEFGGTKEQIINHELITPANGITTKELRKKYNITSHCFPVYLREEVELIHRLMPELQTIYYIGGMDSFSRSTEVELKDVINKYAKGVNMVSFTSDKMSPDSLSRILHGLNPKTSAAIFSSWMNPKYYKTSALMTNRAIFLFEDSGIPLFTLRDNGWMDESSVLLGGYYVNENAYYNRLFPTLSELINGRPAREISFYMASNPRPKLNYQRMLEFNLDPALCPFGTIFSYKPESFLEQHKGDIIGIAFMILLLIFMLTMKSYRDAKSAQQAQLRELDHKQKELQIRQNYYDFIEHLPMGYIHNKMLFDDKGNVVETRAISANGYIREIYDKLGIKVKDLTMTGTFPISGPAFLKCINDARKNGENVVKFKQYFAEDGKYLEFVAIFIGNDEMSVLIKNNTAEEIAKTNLEKANEELRIAINKAEKADHLKDEFLKNMTHEVRTPLNIICGFSELLINKEMGYEFSEEEKTEMERGIASGSALLTTIMGNILEFSDVLNGTFHISTDTCNINDIAKEAIHENSPMKNPNVEINYESDVDDEFTVTSCSSRIKQVVSNMISNACKFTTKGTITLRFEIDEKTGICRYICTDTGCGVPQEKAEYIFERFTKIDQYIPGTGLGLALSRGIARRLNGNLYLDMEYKGGAKFVFEFNPDKRIV